MAKVRINSFLLMISRRSYGVAAENAKVQAAAAAKQRLPSGDKEEIFWMRDPKTGNWVPENQFGGDQVDVAELRDKLLPKKDKLQKHG